MTKSAAILLFVAGALLLLATEFFRVYLIMPFPGSQKAETVGLAWSIDHYRILLRALGIILIAWPFIRLWGSARIGGKIFLGSLMALYAVIFYFFNFRFEADRMFYQPTHKFFAQAAENKVPLNKLVIGIVAGGEAGAYPIQIIGYHHQVRDTLGRIPVMITYCTVCRTGRVFSPAINGHIEDFRLVGMDHFNAMFADATTGSWWQQATGIAVAGPLKDTRLGELSSSQMSLQEWLEQHPDSKILQPDTTFKKDYDDLAGYDIGTIKSGLEKRDSASWKPRSWVIGVRYERFTKAYDWNWIATHRITEDTIGALPVVIIYDRPADFHVWSRVVDGRTLDFDRHPDPPMLQDTTTGSVWSSAGLCTAGPLKGQQLQAVQSYQEFWHSWSHFHPSTTRYQ